ncbi:titin-like [Musca vetustissima]|uniref:titin-like n=1 Tax=Musca vetustissima TaxID=27455 RepID=UPI002AB79E6F|nr:titin-like [Musca vetustissima]
MLKLFIVTLSCVLLAVNGLTYIPSSLRLRRDVSELLAEPKNEYLPPATEEANDVEVTTILPSEETEVQDTAVLGKDGYEYKTVKRVVVRSRRDVSHLNLNYLPPLEDQKPSNEYLPPLASGEQQEEVESLPSNEYLPPVETKQAEETELATEAPEPSKEYLPPVPEAKEASEETTSEEPSKEYLPPAKEAEEEKVNEIEATTEAKINEEITTIAPAMEEAAQAEVKEAVTEAPMEMQDTAVLAADGYHYKQPNEVPMALFAMEQEPAQNPENLAALEEAVVEAEGPENGESAVLAEDGYHYRVIKRRF